jgi:hypothetical protein
MAKHRWRNYVQGRTQDTEVKTTKILHDWIDAYLKESITKIQTLEEIQMKQQSDLRDGEKEKIDILLRRWNQIRTLCGNALKSISS